MNGRRNPAKRNKIGQKSQMRHQMTKKRNVIAFAILAAEILSLVVIRNAYVSGLLAYQTGHYLFIAVVFAMIATFPFSFGSLMLSMAFRVLRNDTYYQAEYKKRLARGSPETRLIWREYTSELKVDERS